MSVNSLYIHIPFCEHICDYCDFTKLQYFTLFAQKYLKELKNELETYHIGQLDTIYVGGGTPTSLEDDLFLELLEMIKPYSKDVKEYTFEANPESLSNYKLEMMKKYGVNRLSIGVESTNDNILKDINRHHTFMDVKNAFSRARKHNFDNINVDLILGLPGMDINQLKADLDNLVSLAIEHISCYSLTVHPHTVFYTKGINEPNDEEGREYYDFVNKYLLDKGFVHYEVSNWAKKGKESQHNLTYWRNNRYFGVGLGASGYIDNIRYTNTKSLTKYLKGEYVEEKEIVDLNDEKEYQIMLNLRTNEGINLDSFKEKFGYDLYLTKQKEIDEMIKLGYLKKEKEKLVPTYLGMMTLDSVILKLI